MHPGLFFLIEYNIYFQDLFLFLPTAVLSLSPSQHIGSKSALCSPFVSCT